MKATVLADPERTVVDILTTLLTGEDCTVGVGVPETWAPTSTPHVQVACDGTAARTQVSARHSMRIVARAGSTSEAKRLALLAEGLLLGWHDGVSFRSSIGLLPARDAQTRAEMASVTLAMTVLAQPIP